MNKRRLLKLADMLEADAKNKKGIRFDISTVAAKADNEGLRGWREFAEGETPALNCGTVACAMGLAAISGAFKRAGMSYHINRSGLYVTFNGDWDFYAAGRGVFGLTDDEIDWLFMPSGYDGPTPKGADGERVVAKRLRDFVFGKASPPA